MDGQQEENKGPLSLQGHIREGDFRTWVFSREQIQAGAQKFLKYAGYELLPGEYAGFAQPHLRARRRQGGKTFELVGVVRTSLEEAVDGYIHLAAMVPYLGESVDYVLVLPPVNEYLLIEFLLGEKGKWYFAIKKPRFMMWLCNPEQETMWCIVGGPRDRSLESYFIHSDQPIDPYIAMRLGRDLLEEEDF